MEKTQAFHSPDNRNCFQKLRDKIFPEEIILTPEVKGEFKAVLAADTITILSFWDRLRALFGGVIITKTLIAMKEEPGETIPKSACYVQTKGQLASGSERGFGRRSLEKDKQR